MEDDLKTKEKGEKETSGSGFLAKLAIIEFIDTTSFHGISAVYRAQMWTARIFWILLIFASSGYCFYGMFRFMNLILMNQRAKT
jgi:hypothetical protein